MICVLLCVTITFIRDVTLKTIFKNFHIILLNSDFPVNNKSNVTKLIGHALCITTERSVSQNLDLGLVFFVMLCSKICITYFFTIFYVLYHKNKTRTYIKILRHTSLEKNVLNI